MNLAQQTWVRVAWFQLAMLALIFVPAGSLRYWQGWCFWLTWLVIVWVLTLWALRNSPDLVRRRMEAGARAETRPAQKAVMAAASVASLALVVLPALDHRLHWTHVPWAVALAGDAAALLGAWIVLRVFQANRFAAATVRVEEGQALCDTGPYGVVRHPMYAGALLMLVGTPLALGSWAGLLVCPLIILLLALRTVDEERLLDADLPGYRDYRRRVRHRLIPGLW